VSDIVRPKAYCHYSAKFKFNLKVADATLGSRYADYNRHKYYSEQISSVPWFAEVATRGENSFCEMTRSGVVVLQVSASHT